MKKFLITLILVLVGTSAFALPIKVGEDTVDVYASIRAYTVFTHTMTDEKAFGICNRPAGKSCSQFAIGLQDNSRAGIKWTHGSFFLNNEWGITNVDAGNAQLRLRFLYGDYKFAGGEKGRIRIGQLPGIVHTSSYYDTKLSADNALQGYGTINDVRRIGINYEIGKFSVSALSMRQDSAEVEAVTGGTFVEIMPRFEAAYSITDYVKVAGTFVRSSGRYNSTDYTQPEVSLKDSLRSVNAGHIMVAANPKLTDKVTLAASGFYAVNGGLYGMVSAGGGGYSKSEAVNRDFYLAREESTTFPTTRPTLKSNSVDEFDNISVYGGAVAVVVDKFEAGFGIQSAAKDTWEENKNSMGIYANYKFRVSNNLRITPEIGYLHSGDNIRRKEAPVTDSDVRGLRLGVQFRFDI